jgi:WD40 repeat protein
MATQRGNRFQKAVVVGLTVLAITLVSSPSTQAAFPGANGKIVFSSPDGIGTINADGTGLTTIVPKDVLLDTCSPPRIWQDPRWSPDGQKLAFQCGPAGWTVNPDGTGMAQIGTAEIRQPDWSPDGQRIAFVRYVSGCYALLTANLDGSAEAEVLPATTPPCGKAAPAWSPAGDLIAFHGGTAGSVAFFTVRSDGTALNGPIGVNAEEVDWSPAGHRLLYDSGTMSGSGAPTDLRTISPDGSSDVRVVSIPGVANSNGGWSPDGTKLVFVRGNNDSFPHTGSLFVADDAGNGSTEILDCVPTASGQCTDPDWQPLPPLPPPDPGYARPRGATPFSVPLVPAFRGCTSPNRAHGAPLAFGSCAPPQQTSDGLTVGTPDANGEGARSIGTVAFRAVTDDLGTPVDDSDLRIEAALSDVRCRVALTGYCTGGALSDYLGALQLAPVLRITDRRSGGAERDPATGIDVVWFSVPIACTDTPASPAGSTCETQTTVDALTPGAIKGGMRTIWELDQITVRDAGIDDPQVEAFATLAVQGVFVP